jgi:ABC-type uncharacterized transport system auxiliary subunit
MSLRSSRFVVALAALTLPLLLADCGGLTGRAAPDQLYVLRPALAKGQGPRIDATLQLLRPVAGPGLDTARIALVRTGNRLDYFAGGSWAGPLPEVAESLFAQTLRGSERFAQVASDAAGMGADLVLAVTLRRFEAEYVVDGEAPHVRLRLECTLSSRRQHRQVAGFDIESEAPAATNRLGSVVAAMEVAAQDAALQLVARSADLAAQALAEEKAATPKT